MNFQSLQFIAHRYKIRRAIVANCSIKDLPGSCTIGTFWLSVQTVILVKIGGFKFVNWISLSGMLFDNFNLKVCCSYWTNAFGYLSTIFLGEISLKSKMFAFVSQT